MGQRRWHKGTDARRKGRTVVKIEVLKEYLVIARLRGFSRAARQLYTSQSNLSGHIAAMERELGFDVIDRTQTGFALTPAGMTFLGCAQTIVDTYERGRADALACSRALPPIRVAEIDTGSSAFEAVTRIEEPLFEFVPTDFSTPFLEPLVSGAVDIEVTQMVDPMRHLAERDPEHAYAVLPANPVPLAIAMAADNPLAGVAELTSEDLNGATVTISCLAFFEDWRRVINQAVGPNVHLSYQLREITSMAEIARADLGDTLHICALANVRKLYRSREDIVIRTALDGRPLMGACYLVYRSDSPDPRVRELAEKLSQALTVDC